MDEMTSEPQGNGEMALRGDLDVEDAFANIPPDPDNLVPVLMQNDETAEWLKKQASSLVRRVKGDKEARTEWMERREAQIKLFAGIIPDMGYPAEGMRAPHDPIVCRTILQMWTRGTEQICPVKGDLIQVHPVGPEDDELAQEREWHMNFQLRNRVPNWVRGHRTSYQQFLMSGSIFREHSFDPAQKVTMFEHLTADDVIIPYSRKDIDPLMKRVPRITRVLRYYRWELEDIAETGKFANLDKLFLPENAPKDIEPSPLDEQAEEIDGVKRQVNITSGDDPDMKQREVYRCHMWMKLPKEKRMRPVTFIVDVSTNLPLSLTFREDEDPVDRVRFDADEKLWQIQTQNITGQYKTAMQMWQQAAQQAQMMGAAPPPQPPEPKMPPEPEPVKMIPLHNMIHYRLFDNPHGFYGLGVGYLLENANELVNELEKSYLLAATFQNMQQGFLPKGTLAPRGELRLRMGKFIQTQLEAEQMAGIKAFQFAGPSESLHKFIKEHKADAYTLVADVDTLTGEAGPTNETKAAAQQRMSNATALMTAVSAIYIETMAEEPKMLARDNALFMPEEEQYWVTSPNKEKPQQPGMPPEPPPEPGKRLMKTARRDMYANPFDFTFTADQRLQTQPERVQTAAGIVDRLLNSPYGQSPSGAPLFWLAFKDMFSAMDKPQFVKALGPMPQAPQPPPPPTPMSQADENQGFFQDKDHPVLPDDDHEGHLVDIDDLKKSPYYAKMSSTGKQLLDRHEQGHVGALYKKEMTLRQQQQGDQNGNQASTQGGGNSQRGVSGMGGRPGVPGVQGQPAPGGGGMPQPPSIPM